MDSLSGLRASRETGTARTYRERRKKRERKRKMKGKKEKKEKKETGDTLHLNKIHVKLENHISISNFKNSVIIAFTSL